MLQPDEMEEQGGVAEGAAPLQDVPAEAEAVPISAKQLKRLRRLQEREALKPAQRQFQRQRKKANRLEARLAGKDLGKEKREANNKKKYVSPARVIIDLSFDDFMTEKEIGSMSQQLTALYNSNRRASHRFSSIVFCGPTGQSLFDTAVGKRMETNMQGHWRRWDYIDIRENGGLEGVEKGGEESAVCSKEQLVYLTADSTNTLEAIEDNKVYIIGGLVDRNRHKSLCADKAKRLGIQTAKFPIPPGLLNTSAVLTVNLVVDVLLSFNETSDWESTLAKCLPKRKMADRVKVKEAKAEGEESGEGSQEERRRTE